MKKAIGSLTALIVCAVALGLAGQVLNYVGVEKCQICHRTDSQGRQYPIWQASQHSSSFSVLGKPEVVAKAKSMGIQDPTDAPQCLGCHSPLAEKAPELKAEGVTCEACHGPGSEYKKLSLMKNPKEAQKNGLAAFADAEDIKTLCLSCHANAHDRPFDFAQAWTKIKHGIPGKD